MFVLNDDLSIYVTRGDVVFFGVTAEENGVPYKFKPDEVVRMKVFAKKNCENVVLQKDFYVTQETERVEILLDENDTKIGDVISKPNDYWYEIELNPFTNPQTIIGYDDDGAKIFKLFPEGNDSYNVIEEEDIPVVDSDFSFTSERPLQNQVISRSLLKLNNDLEETKKKLTGKDIVPITTAEYNALVKKGTWERNTVYVITDADDMYTIAENALSVAENAEIVANNSKCVADKTASDLAYALEHNVPKMQIKSYTGTGTDGADGYCEVSFDFAPDIFIMLDGTTSSSHQNVMYSDELTTEFVKGKGFIAQNINNNPMFVPYGKKSADGKTIYWYVTGVSESEVVEQLNKQGEKYHVLGLKIKG